MQETGKRIGAASASKMEVVASFTAVLPSQIPETL
jgi:hypothetical protein